MLTKILIVIILIFSCFALVSFYGITNKVIDNRSFKDTKGDFLFFGFCSFVAAYFYFMYYIQ